MIRKTTWLFGKRLACLGILAVCVARSVAPQVAMIENRRKVDDKDPNKPQLRKKPSSGSDDKDSKGDEDERPTLKRR